MIHHAKITPYRYKKFKKNDIPFEFKINKRMTKQLINLWYDVFITNEENEKLWKAIEQLQQQQFNNQVRFIKIPVSWDGKDYAFYSLVQGTKTEIKGIFEKVYKKEYPDSEIEFEY